MNFMEYHYKNPGLSITRKETLIKIHKKYLAKLR